MNSSSKFFILLTSLIIGLFVWSYFSKVDITFKAPGHIETQSNSTTIDTMVDGQIETVLIMNCCLVFNPEEDSGEDSS